MNATPSTPTAASLPDYAPVPASAFGPAPNEQGYCVGQVERNLYWVTDGVYQAAFLTTKDGVVLFDAPPSIGHNLQRAVDEIAQANGVSSKVTYLVHTHHHADHAGASSLFGKDVVRIGHEETRRLLLRDDDPARPAPDETAGCRLRGAGVRSRRRSRALFFAGRSCSLGRGCSDATGWPMVRGLIPQRQREPRARFESLGP